MIGQTVGIYTNAVMCFANICACEWSNMSELDSKHKQMYVETIAHVTDDHPNVKYDFDTAFPNFPSYLRRAAITHGAGKISSWESNLQKWSDSGQKGRKPSYPNIKLELPTLYYKNTFVFTDVMGKELPKGQISEYAKIKVYCSQRDLTQDRKLTDKEKRKIKKGDVVPSRLTWNWILIKLKHSDVEYLKRKQSAGVKILCPTIRKKGKQYILQFGIEAKPVLSDTPIPNQKILAVDLGINTPATCCVMKADGTILARRFYKPQKDMGCLDHRLALISRAQSHGAAKTPVLWRLAKNANRKLSDGTADFIISLAKEFGVDIIVFEHLNLTGKKHGKKKVRLHYWRAKYVQRIISNRAHTAGIRISTVCAWGTSRLAYDGSGPVERNYNGNYSVCKFKTGKIYNCDLSASYNIGARYFIRELQKITLKTMPKAWSELKAEVPELMKRTTCTWSSLIRMYAVLCAFGPQPLNSSPMEDQAFPQALKADVHAK
ncbi:MAG: transposase [Anaerolineaceae bacterium]|nr:transposase [Anaerolineaceae bacterium]